MAGKDQIMQMTENPYDLKLKMVCRDNIERLETYLTAGRSFPLSMEILPTNKCNLNCLWCIDRHFHNTDEIALAPLLGFIEDFAEMGGKSITWSGGGEPGIYPYIKKAIRHASRHGLDQGMMTNGNFPTGLVPIIGQNLEWVRISLDTANSSTYKRIKGVNALPRVRNNIKDLSKHPIKVNVNVNLSKQNERDLFMTAQEAKKWGADVFQLRPVLPCPAEKSIYIPCDLKEIVGSLKTLEDSNFFVSVSYDKFNELMKPRSYDSCRYHNFIFILNANGDVCVCAYRLYEDDFTFGNIYEHSLPQIWNSEKWQEVIENTNNMDFSKCQACCKGHELNKYLHALTITNGLKDRRFL